MSTSCAESMSNPRSNLSNLRFGRLLAVDCFTKRNARGVSKVWWNCVCDCGRRKAIKREALASGRTQSCGCLALELMKSNQYNFRHGEAGRDRRNNLPRLYRIWQAMRSRCRSATNPSYYYYGSRGIEVCPEWNDYLAFRQWAGRSGYSNELSIDRINPDGNYEPGNCRWANQLTQVENRRKYCALPNFSDQELLAEVARRGLRG